MPAIDSLLINLVEDKHSAEYIADVFARKEIANVSHILLIPYSIILKDVKLLQCNGNCLHQRMVRYRNRLEFY